MEKLVIGLMGVKEAGKSTVAQILAEDHEFAILEPGMQVMELLLDINPIMQTSWGITQYAHSSGSL
jgi:dephospho-CoA kinase